MQTIVDPNLSIIAPGGCNASCKFCFWKDPGDIPSDYIQSLGYHMSTLPSQFHQISITGGEPTASPEFNDILTLIKMYKKKYRKVVLTTNGYKLLDWIPKLLGVVDHVNISRHSIYDRDNEYAFLTDTVPSKNQIADLCGLLGMMGIDVTLSAVLGYGVHTSEDVRNYVKFAKEVGASAVALRRKHGVLKDHPSYIPFNNYIPEVSSCPVCISKRILYKGMPVTWKYSLIEPNEEIEEIYELIIQPDGRLTTDWQGKQEIQFKKSLYEIPASYVDGRANSSCGYSGCK